MNAASKPEIIRLDVSRNWLDILRSAPGVNRHRSYRPGRHPLRSVNQHPESRPASFEMLLRRRARRHKVGTVVIP